MSNMRIKALKEFAKAVGCTLRVEAQDDGSKDYVLYDEQKEPLVTEFDSYDMKESIGVYKGSHSNYEAALQAFEEATQ